MMPSTPWLVLQLADSAFPAGGFVHSGGLEAAAELGLVGDRPGQIPFATLAEQVTRQLGRAALPFVGAGYDGDPPLAAADARADAFWVMPVANRASRAQGRALASVARRVWDDEPVRELGRAAAATNMHHAPFFGALGRALGLARPDVLALFVHGAARGLVSAAVRLGLSGPIEGQRTFHALAAAAAAAVEDGAALRLDDAAQTHPLFELFGAQHERLGARLFQS